MRVIELQGSELNSVSDFYGALIRALGGPASHARNINAFLEFIVWNETKPIDSPYVIKVLGTNKLPKEILDETSFMQQAIIDARAESLARRGYDVEVYFELAPD